MIDKSEILRKAKELALLPSTIEKDYVLGWVLISIQHHELTRDSWIFKGGTCLKKCFFYQYRFSEDLDFTLRDPEEMDKTRLEFILKELSHWIYENSGIEIPEETVSLELYQNLHAGISARGKFPFVGPLKQKATLSRIKLDLTADEKIVFDPEKRPIFHDYSDQPADSPHVLCYSFEEIFVEKLRALVERARPRDLYDIIHLHEQRQRFSSKQRLLDALEKKCSYKKIPIPNMKIIETHPLQSEFSSEWENMLRHQVSKLRPFEHFWGSLADVFQWIYSEEENQ